MDEPKSYPAESPELWKKIHDAAAKDDKKLRDLLTEADLLPQLAKMFVAAVQEESELAAIEKAGDGMAERFASLGQELALLGATVPTKLEKMREQIEQQQQLRAQRLACERAVDSAKRASSQRQWLLAWLPELFSQSVPKHAGMLSSLQVAEKTANVARGLGVTGLYSVGVDGWRKVGESSEQTERKRKYVSFSPLIKQR